MYCKKCKIVVSITFLYFGKYENAFGKCEKLFWDTAFFTILITEFSNKKRVFTSV